MQLLKLKQFGLILCCLISLIVPSVAACNCPHEEEVSYLDSHADNSPSEEVSREHHQDGATTPVANLTETVQTAISETDCCDCVSPTPRAFSKSETVKIEKQVFTAFQSIKIEIKPIQQLVSIKTIDFAAPFYLSDSFYNISPGRAPPRL